MVGSTTFCVSISRAGAQHALQHFENQLRTTTTYFGGDETLSVAPPPQDFMLTRCIHNPPRTFDPSSWSSVLVPLPNLLVPAGNHGLR